MDLEDILLRFGVPLDQMFFFIHMRISPSFFFSPASFAFLSSWPQI